MIFNILFCWIFTYFFPPFSKGLNRMFSIVIIPGYIIVFDEKENFLSILRESFLIG